VKSIKKNLSIILLLAALATAAVFGIFYDYYDIYLLSLNGSIISKRTDIKQAMYVTVSKREHNISHYWPLLQELAEIGDSVIKMPKEYDIILIKKTTHKAILCKYKK
jgi:hypothetical protein